MKTRLRVFILLGVLAYLAESGAIKREHRKRGLTQQQQLDEVLNQQIIEFEKFLLEQQTQIELAKQEQLRQLQDAQVQLFQAQQQHEVFLANHQAALNNEKIAQLNQNRPAGQTVDELKSSMPVIAEDAALGGANSNTKRKQEHSLKIDQQLRHEQTKKQILEQQQLQIDAMNTQNQIQAETRSDQQEAFISSKLEIENQLAQEREMLIAQIEAQRRERAKKAAKLQKLINGEYDDEDEDSEEEGPGPQFARLVQSEASEARQKAFELQMADRQAKYLQLQQDRELRRKDEQYRQAQKLQEILHETQSNQEEYERTYQKNLEGEKQDQLKQSKMIQEELHNTQRQLAAQEENQYGVKVREAVELAGQVGDQQTRDQKNIILAHQERIRLAHKMQQNHRLTQDINHETNVNDIKQQQAVQSEHMSNQHSIQIAERLRQREALENLRNQLRGQIIGGGKKQEVAPVTEAVTATTGAPEQTAVVNPETVYLEPRFFQESQPEAMSKKENLVVTAEVKSSSESGEVKNKTVQITCDNKENGMYRNENDCNSYYVCTDKQIYKFACPSGTSFSMEHCTCDWPTSSSECVVPLLDNRCSKTREIEEEKPAAAKEAPVTDTEEPWSAFTCNNKEKGFYRDPVDCTKFYYCEVFNKPAPLIGQTVIKNDFYCPNSFHFDVFTCKCGAPTSNSCSKYALTTYCTHSS